MTDITTVEIVVQSEIAAIQLPTTDEIATVTVTVPGIQGPAGPAGADGAAVGRWLYTLGHTRNEFTRIFLV